MNEDTCLRPDKDYSSLLGGKLTVFTFYNSGFVLAKVCRVILGLFQLILLFMTYFIIYASLGVSGHVSVGALWASVKVADCCDLSSVGILTMIFISYLM
jgi:hypothetical protein